MLYTLIITWKEMNKVEWTLPGTVLSVDADRKQCAAAQTAAVKRKYSLRRTQSLKNRKIRMCSPTGRMGCR